MKLGEMLMLIGGAKKAAREMQQILEAEEGQAAITISREVLSGWFRKMAGLIMLMEKFDVE